MLSRFTGFVVFPIEIHNCIPNTSHSHEFLSSYAIDIAVQLMGMTKTEKRTAKTKTHLPFEWEIKANISTWFHTENLKCRWHRLLEKPKGDIKSNDILEISLLLPLLLQLSAYMILQMGRIHVDIDRYQTIDCLSFSRCCCCCSYFIFALLLLFNAWHSKPNAMQWIHEFCLQNSHSLLPSLELHTNRKR